MPQKNFSAISNKKKRHNIVENITSEEQSYEWQLKEIQVCFIH